MQRDVVNERLYFETLLNWEKKSNVFWRLEPAGDCRNVEKTKRGAARTGFILGRCVAPRRSRRSVGDSRVSENRL